MTTESQSYSAIYLKCFKIWILEKKAFFLKFLNFFLSRRAHHSSAALNNFIESDHLDMIINKWVKFFLNYIPESVQMRSILFSL